MAVAKLPWRTAYSGQVRMVTETGKPTAPKYEHIINKHGLKELKQTGEINVYEKIQENLEESKLENIIARVVQGDTSALRPDGLYMDTSELPKNMIEARQAIQKMENTWQTLPVELRAKYNHNLDEFIAKAGKTEWLEDMGLLKKTESVKANKQEPITRTETAETKKGENEA